MCTRHRLAGAPPQGAQFIQAQTDSIPLPAWPGGHKAAVSLTFDLDADVGDSWRKLSSFLTTLSEAKFGAGRGLERLLRVLQDHQVPSSFFVPGEIAERHPVEVKAVMQAGHEIGHHGYIHLAIDRIREVEQREEMYRGLEALDKLGVRPAGYRCPGWDLTRYTLDLLVKEGFRYDSSCMGDDRPYYLHSGDSRMLELPVHWSLDDWVFFRFANGNIYDGGVNRDGELFVYDADMEYDFNTSWYRPTRINHVVSGAEFGWRNGAGKYPEFYYDNLPATLNIGPGSPTGCTFGYGAKFPAKYQNALFALDWSWGKLYAIHMEPKGASYVATKEEFLSGSPLPLEVQEEFEKLTRGRVVEAYGLTEAAPATHCNPLGARRRHGSIGLPLPDTEARIVDPETGADEQL